MFRRILGWGRIGCTLNALHLSLVFLACSDVDTSIAGHCDDRLERIDIDKTTPLSYSAKDIIDAFYDTWKCDLSWYEVDSVGTLFPLDKPFEASISLSFEEEKAYFIDSEYVGDDDVDLICVDWIEIPSILKIETDDGVFSETFSVDATSNDYYDESGLNLSVRLDTLSDVFLGTYDFAPNQYLQQLPNRGTRILFSFVAPASSPPYAVGKVVEWFESDSVESQNDGYVTQQGYGAHFDTVYFECSTIVNTR